MTLTSRPVIRPTIRRTARRPPARSAAQRRPAPARKRPPQLPILSPKRPPVAQELGRPRHIRSHRQVNQRHGDPSRARRYGPFDVSADPCAEVKRDDAQLIGAGDAESNE